MAKGLIQDETPWRGMSLLVVKNYSLALSRTYLVVILDYLMSYPFRDRTNPYSSTARNIFYADLLVSDKQISFKYPLDHLDRHYFQVLVRLGTIISKLVIESHIGS